MDNLNRIRSLSRVIRTILAVVMVSMPLVTVSFWLLYNQLPASTHEMVKNIIPADLMLPLAIRLGAAAVDLLFMAVVTGLLYHLYALFGFYSKQEIFTANPVRCYSRIGFFLILLAPASVVCKTLYTGILTLTNPAGQRQLSIGLGSNELFLVLTGLAVLCISWVMAEGVKLEEERKLVI